MGQNFEKIVKERGLGGVSAWSLGEDTYDRKLLADIQKGAREMSATVAGC